METGSNGAKWCSFYSLSSTKESTPDHKGDSVPPLQPIFKESRSGAKNSSETETLGCETGTMYTTEECTRDDILSERFGFITLEEAEERRRERKEQVERRIKRVKTGTKFLPTLTSRTGENCVHIVRERENGRMVMYAVRQQPAVIVERRDGQLTLRLPSCSSDEMKAIPDDENKGTTTTKEGEEREDDDYLGIVGKVMNGNENGGEVKTGKEEG